jgi:putative copper resistance protein D
VSARVLALDWRIDVSVCALLVQLGGLAMIYLTAVARGHRRNRRGRRWPKRYTLCFLAGLVAAAIDLCSGIGNKADAWLSAHMLEHMTMWVLVAPLLAAGAPVRLAFFSLSRRGRRRLLRCLQSPVVSVLTSPAGSVSLFSAVIFLTHVPAVYGLTLTNELLHDAEHGLYLLTALLVWSPLIGADPLPHRPGGRVQVTCMFACMLPMMLIALWLATASDPLYSYYVRGSASVALHDQYLAATIMWAGGIPAFAIPALARVRFPVLNHRQPASLPRAQTQASGTR